ncbi:MAG: transglutaminase domain-containing protein [Acidobacteriota bacterium]
MSRPRDPRSRVGPWLRALALALAAAVVCRPLAVPIAVPAAALAAVLGAWLGDRVARGPLRLPVALCLGGLLGAAAIGLARLLVSWAWVADLLGPVVLLQVGDVLLWPAIVLPIVFSLRLLAARRPTLALLEVVAVATALAATFSAHRQGMVHRPLRLGDWAWSRGIDPATVFLGLGGVAFLVLAALLLRRARARRLPLHFAALLLVALGLGLFVRVEGLPKPDPSADLGLTGEPEKRPGDDGDGSGQGTRDQSIDDLEFKDEYGQAGQQAPVAVVVLRDDYAPPTGVYYFRQSAFSQYNGRRLVQATRDDVDRDLIARFPARPIEIDATPTDVGRRPLRTSMGLLIDHVRPFALDAPVRLEPSPNPNPMRFQRTFEVRSRVPTLPTTDLIGRAPGDAEWGLDQWRHFTETPADPRYADLARQLISQLRPEFADDPLARALAVKNYLDTNGIYSRRSRHAGADDPAASFLFGDLTGYCVHFAHAAAYLLRSLDIPTRVAAGYAVSERDRGGGSTILIRGQNAHAWPEIYLEDIGWTVVDPAPEQSLDPADQAPDPQLQQMLGEMLRQETDPRALDDPLREPIDWAAWWRAAAAALLAGLAVLYAVKIWRAAVPRWRPKEAWRLGYRAVLDRLAEVGLHRRPGESREAFARRVGEVAPSFARLTDLHLATALGSSTGGASESDLPRRAMREVRLAVPRWRRAVALLDPIAWLRVR